MEPVKKYRIYVASFVANLSNLAFGTCVGWSSPVVPKLRDHTGDSPLSIGITKAEEGWITSVITLGALASSLVAGPLAGKFGRKRMLQLSALLILISYILLIFASEIWIIYLARIIQGISGGLVIAALPMYSGEIATDDCRGAVGSLMTIFIILGILYVYLIGPYVSYLALQLCCMAPPIFFLITFFFIPESPYFLAVKKRSGTKSLQFLRGQSAKAVEEEMSQIQKNVDEDMSNSGTLSDIFHSRGYKRALLISCGLLIFQQLSGTTAVTFNSQSIFSNAKSSLDPAIATIMLAGVQLVSNIVTPFVVEYIGRRIILLISAIGMCLALLALGTFFYILSFGDASGILWLPVPALITFNILYSFGFGPIPWAVLGEMFPSNIKPIAVTIACMSSWLTAFCVTRWFPELNALGAYYPFWIFGSLCIVALFFVIFVVIETRGLSFLKIQEKLHK